jgi:hypothetical protein
MVIANPAVLRCWRWLSANLAAPGTPPGRNDPCPCGSGKKTKRCCGVDSCRFLPLRGRRRGVVPADLAARVDQMAGDFTVRFLARTFLPTRLGGLSPAVLSEEERASCASCSATSASRSTRRSRFSSGSVTGDREAGGLVQSARTGSVAASVWTGLWASSRERSRSGCRPPPTRTAAAATTGQDIYGNVLCSQTLRCGHLGILAAAGGLWHSRNTSARPYAETTAGELAQLITGRRRLGGKDIAEIHRLLAELEQLELSAAP